MGVAVIPSLVYDIETENWTTFVVGATYDGENVQIYRDERELLDALLATEGVVVAHNGGRFDHLWLLDAMDRHGKRQPCDARTNGQGIVELRIGKLVLKDSARLYPMSLAELSAGGKRSLDDLCSCAENCGGYCAIRRGMSAHIRKRVEEYLTADVVELWRALEHMAGVAERCGLKLGGTVGSTAWKSAQAFLDLPAADYPRNLWAAMREGYYGGRVEVWKRESAEGEIYDVNSMYPWALSSVEFPWSFLGQVHGDRAGRDYARGLPGVYVARVSVPESFAPPLPLRTAERILFPFGTFTGSFASNDLAYAESKGTRIERIHSGVVFSEARGIFAPWVNFLFDLRIKYGKKTREGKWLKLVLNSLSGKLGSQSVARRVVVFPDVAKLQPCSCPRPTQCRCGAHRPIDDRGRVFERTITTRRVESCAHAPWAAFLTAAARIKLHSVIDESSVYGDTDSQYRETPLPAEAVGTALGTWERQGQYRGFKALAPKVYSYTGDKGRVVAAKGIPLHHGRSVEATWEEIESGADISWESMAGLRRAKGGDFFRRVNQHRRVTANTGGRLPDGPVSTRPPRAP